MKPSHTFMIAVSAVAVLTSAANMSYSAAVHSLFAVPFALISAVLAHQLVSYLRDLRRLRAAK